MRINLIATSRNDINKLKNQSCSELYGILNHYIQKRNTIINMISNPLESQAYISHNLIMVSPLTSKYRLLAAMHEMGHIYTTKLSDMRLLEEYFSMCGHSVTQLECEIENNAWEWAKKVLINFNIWCENCEIVRKICIGSYDTSNTIECRNLLNEIYGEELVNPRTGLLYSLD